ncbi:MAG: hypothetical protein ACXVC6_04625 [Bacteroidia bacterium]
MIRAAKILFILLASGLPFRVSAQLLTNLGAYHNQLFVNSGYYLSFANYSIGWIHTEHPKFLKRDIAGIIDFSFPLSDTSHTKFVFRKGFQANIASVGSYRFPVALISSSDKVVTDVFKMHDFITDLFFNPGVYQRGYTIALDADYKVIWLSKQKDTKGHGDAENTKKLHHARSKFALGVALGLNHRRFTYLVRGGYQEHSDYAGRSYNFYAIFQVGFNCNFKRKKTEEEDSELIKERN